MRRDRAAEPGLNDFLIVAASRRRPALGVKRVSLNFAVFRAALARGERIGAGPVLRAWRGLLVFLSRWFQIESLYKFNAKFRPVWEPRFFVYPSTQRRCRAGIGAGRALCRPEAVPGRCAAEPPCRAPGVRPSAPRPRSRAAAGQTRRAGGGPAAQRSRGRLDTARWRHEYRWPA